MKIIQPFQDDCADCQWVGWFISGNVYHNVYLCGKTVKIRYGNEPHEYWSATAGQTVKGPLGNMTKNDVMLSKDEFVPYHGGAMGMKYPLPPISEIEGR